MILQSWKTNRTYWQYLLSSTECRYHAVGISGNKVIANPKIRGITAWFWVTKHRQTFASRVIPVLCYWITGVESAVCFMNPCTCMAGLTRMSTPGLPWLCRMCKKQSRSKHATMTTNLQSWYCCYYYYLVHHYCRSKKGKRWGWSYYRPTPVVIMFEHFM